MTQTWVSTLTDILKFDSLTGVADIPYSFANYKQGFDLQDLYLSNGIQIKNY